MYQVTYLNFLTSSTVTAVEGSQGSTTSWPPFPLKWQICRGVRYQVYMPVIFLRTILLGELKICNEKIFSSYLFF